MIKAVLLTPGAFAPFGQVLQGSGAPTERQGFAATMENGRPGARPNMTYMKLLPEGGAIRIEALERHPFSNQTFIPLNGTRHLVAVCPSTPEGEPLIAAMQVFLAEGSQAVNYNPRVWHAPRMALSAPGEFVMFRWDDGSDSDTELIRLETALSVALPVL
jgi:ureidoglycolate lyase